MLISILVPVGVDVDFIDIVHHNGGNGHDFTGTGRHQRHRDHGQEEVTPCASHHVVDNERRYITYSLKQSMIRYHH